MEKKKIIIIIIIFLIILIGLTITLKILNAKKEADEELEIQLTEREELSANAKEQYFSDKICPQGMATIYTKYDGSNDINDLYRSLYKLVKFIENSYDEISILDDIGIQEYYKNNWWNIKKSIGITDAQELSKFVNYIKSIGFSNEKYKKCKIIPTSYQEENNYLTFNISFSYEEKEDFVNLKVYFAKEKGIDPEIKYEPIN